MRRDELFLADIRRTLYRRPSADPFEPSAQIGKLCQIDAIRLVAPDPGPACHVGNRVVAAEKITVGETAFHHAIEANDLIGIALDRIVDLVFLVLN